MLLQVLKRFSAPIHSLDIICKIKPTSALNIFYRAGIVSVPPDLLRNLSRKIKSRECQAYNLWVSRAKQMLKPYPNKLNSMVKYDATL